MKLRLGTSVVQLSARTPTACAMASLTLDHLSGGRHILGLGVSGPQVVEGWYGQRFPKPLARTREYIDIVRQVWAREAPVTSAGPHYPLPLSGEGTTGLGKALKPIVHPLRADIPIMLGAEGPKNIALAAEICDGWLPIFYSPRLAPMYNEWLDEGFARPCARRSREDFEICATAQVMVTDDRAATMAAVKPFLAPVWHTRKGQGQMLWAATYGDSKQDKIRATEGRCTKRSTAAAGHIRIARSVDQKVIAHICRSSSELAGPEQVAFSCVFLDDDVATADLAAHVPVGVAG